VRLQLSVCTVAQIAQFSHDTLPCSPPLHGPRASSDCSEGKGKTLSTWSRAAARGAVSRAKRGSRRPSTDGNGSAGGRRRKEAGVVYPPGTPRPARSGRGGASSRSLRAHRHSQGGGGGGLPPLPRHQLRYGSLFSSLANRSDHYLSGK
jgi:hypothetical protein